MKFLYGIIIAFSMYSKIPMPKIEWSKERMEYVMCFFPLVGVVLAVLTWASGILWFSLRPGDLLRAVVGACLPILVTGGIHLDGFLDVVDARASWQTPERRREILKDPHTGAFAIIWACVYFCAYVGCITELKLEYYLPSAACSWRCGRSAACRWCCSPRLRRRGWPPRSRKGRRKPR